MKNLIMFVISLLFFFVFFACDDTADENENNTGSDNDTYTDNNDVDNDADSNVDNDIDSNVDNDTDTDSNVDNDTDNDISEESLEMKYQEADEHAQAVSNEIVSANSNLGMQLFDAISSSEAGQNVMISPLSISIAMAMVINGASGENLEEMKEVLGFNDMTLDAVNSQFYELIQSLVWADKDMVLSIADSVWMDAAFESRVKEDFLSALENSYGAQPYILDFSLESAPDTINNWVSEHTNGKIEKIVGEIGPYVVMYLINAIYFKAAWTIEFDKNRTYDDIFTTSEGTEKEVKMMTFYDLQEFAYKNTGDYRVIRLPYGRKKFSFYGILPDEKYNIDEFITSMKNNDVKEYLKDLVSTELPVYIPRFKFEYEKSLVDVFKSFGMEKAFTPGGFLNLAEGGEDISISEIKHKTFIEVNEDGTEAAGATTVEVEETADEVSDVEPPSFRADRPFVFIIRDDRSGTILFMGKVEDPTVEK